MLENLRKRVKKLKSWQRFAVRIIYPMILFTLLNLVVVIARLPMGGRPMIIFFIVVWAIIEWQVFFKAKMDK